MGEAIAITSGKGGVGKSSVTLNLGMMLAMKQKRVCLIDMDLGLKNLDLMMDLQNRVIYDLKDVLEGKCPLRKAIIKDKHCANLYLLPACKSMRIHDMKTAEIKRVVDLLKHEFDYVLLDTPAGIESGFLCSLPCVERVLLVSTLDVTSLQDGDRVIGLLLKEGLDQIDLIINRYQPRFVEKKISLSLEDAAQWLGIDLLGYIFEDEEVMRANNYHFAAIMQSESLYACFYALAKRLCGEAAPLPKYREKKLLAKLFGS